MGGTYFLAPTQEFPHRYRRGGDIRAHRRPDRQNEHVTTAHFNRAKILWRPNEAPATFTEFTKLTSFDGRVCTYKSDAHVPVMELYIKCPFQQPPDTEQELPDGIPFLKNWLQKRPEDVSPVPNRLRDQKKN